MKKERKVTFDSYGGLMSWDNITKGEGLEPGQKRREPLRVFRKARVESARIERENSLSEESTLALPARSVDVLRFR